MTCTSSPGSAPALPRTAEGPDLLGTVRLLAAATPDVAAIVDLSTGATTTWAVLQRAADATSRQLADLGVRPGDRVGVQLPNWAEFFVFSLATLQMGAIVVPILPALGPREVGRMIAAAGVRVLACAASFRGHRPADALPDAARLAEDAGLGWPLRHVLTVRGEADPTHDGHWAAQAWTPTPPQPTATPTTAPPSPHPTALAPDRPAQIVFTSGSTGRPKAVVQGWTELGLVTDMLVSHLGLTRADRILGASPVAHQTGFICNMLLSWRLGIPVVLQDVWDPARAAREAIGVHRVTYVQGATTFLIDLAAAYEHDATLPAPDSLRLFVTIGTPAPEAQLRRAAGVLDAAVLAAYGSSEICLGTVSSPSDPPEWAWGSAGRPMPGVELRIVDGRGRPLPTGADGALLVRSPTMFRGYLGDERATRAAFDAQGWFRTGDLAHVDADGMLHLTGRESDLVNRGGEKVPVAEVEGVLLARPDVAETAVVAQPDPRLGERACAFVVPRPGAPRPTLADVRAWLEQTGITRLYWPEDVVVADALPRSATGKIDRRRLRELAAQRVREPRVQGRGPRA